MKKELLETAKANGISSGVAETLADKLAEQGYTLQKTKKAQEAESSLKVQPAKDEKK